MKFCYLKGIGWKGFSEGAESGVYCVAPLARLNAAEGMATPQAHEAYLKYHATLGGRPVHHTLANHWPGWWRCCTPPSGCRNWPTIPS